MNICLSVFWWLNLDNQVNVGDVEASRSDISGYKDLELALLEPLDRDLSLVLCDIAVHYFHLLFDFLGQNQLVSILLRLREYDCFGVSSIADEHVGQCSHPVVERALNRQVIHLPGRLVLEVLGEVDDLESSSHVLSCDVSYPNWDRGREEQKLNIFGQGSLNASEYVVHVFLEAKLEHDVSLVEHNCLQLSEVDIAPFDVVEHATGRSDQNVHSLSQLPGLIVDADAAVNCQ